MECLYTITTDTIHCDFRLLSELSQSEPGAVKSREQPAISLC